MEHRALDYLNDQWHAEGNPRGKGEASSIVDLAIALNASVVEKRGKREGLFAVIAMATELWRNF